MDSCLKRVEKIESFCMICDILSRLTFDTNIDADQVMKERSDAVEKCLNDPMCTRHSEFFSEDHEKWKTLVDSSEVSFSGRNVFRKPIRKRKFKNLVINCSTELREDVESLLKLHHINIEFVHELARIDSQFYFITNFFVAKLLDVWENKLSIDIFDAFCGLLNGLKYLKAKNICHGFIHDRNIAFDGKHWYISGLVGLNACFLEPSRCIRSPRNFKRNQRELKNFLIPADDLWQLIFMFFLTKFGLSTFRWSGGRFNAYGIICWNNDAELYCLAPTTNQEDIEIFQRIKKMLFAGIHPRDVRHFVEDKHNNGSPKIFHVNFHFTIDFRFEKYEENYREFEKMLFVLKK